MKKIVWPNNKSFAFTVIDDTDAGTLENLKPVYDYLYEKGLRTTKTVWVYPSRDFFKGDSLEREEYKNFISDLNNKGFEIASHGPGSGSFSREEIITSFKVLEEMFGNHPSMHINHGRNPDGIYWGTKRFSFPIDKIYEFIRKYWRNVEVITTGDDPQSEQFWGDYAKANIHYIRNRVFSGINTIKIDEKMPYMEKRKINCSNYWFSSSDGYNCDAFVRLLSRKNIEKLAKEGGCCIVYTHFAYDFIDKDGNLREDFKQAIDIVSSMDGYFATATEILDILKSQKKSSDIVSGIYLLMLDLRWFFERIYRKLFWRV